ncbi:hypothetical protein EAE96_007619 [Botrytis aclada]|nr:hypothetical protein EAE96_007619 [Botrytis aclada]
MRPTSLPQCLLQVAACGIALIPFAHAIPATVYSTVTRYRISVVPQYTTYTDVSYSIITYTAPPSIHTEYVTATEVKRRTTTIFGGTATVIEPAQTVTVSECDSTTQSSSVAPSSAILSSSTVSSDFTSSSSFTIPPLSNVNPGSSFTSDISATSLPQLTFEPPTTTTGPAVTGGVSTEEPGATTLPPSEPTRVPSADTPAGTYNEVDCYSDEGDTGFPLAPPITDSTDPETYDTVNHCLEFCSTADRGNPFRYGGIGPGHCYCSNNLVDEAEPTTDCSHPCPGDSTQICGGAPPSTRKLRRRAPGTAIIIYELEGYVPPTSVVTTDIGPTETPGPSSTSEIIVTEEPGITSTEILPTETLGASLTTETVVTQEPSVTSTQILPTETLGATSATQTIVTEEPGTTSTGVVPTETLGASSTTEIIVTEEPGATSTSEINTEGPGATSTSTVVTEEPGVTTTTEAVGTEGPGATSTTEAINTQEPGVTSTSEGIVSTSEAGATTTSGVVNTEESGATSTSEVNTEPPGATNTSDAEEPGVTTSSEIVNTEGPSITTSSVPGETEIVSTEGPGVTTTSGIIDTEEPGATSTTSPEEIGPATSTTEVLTTEEPGVSTTSEVPEGTSTGTGIPPVSNVAPGSTTTITTIEVPESTTEAGLTTEVEITTTAPLSTSEQEVSSTSSSPVSTSVAPPSYNYVCASIPNLFNVVIDEPGKPKQWLSQRNFPDAGTVEGTWGYDTLPPVLSSSQAARFNIGFGNAFQAKCQSDNAPISGAVRLTALGSPLQLFTADHISDSMRVFTASIGADCSLGLDIPNTGNNILAICSGIFTILTPAKQIQRGDACTQVRAFAVAVSGPSSTLSTTIASPTGSSTEVSETGASTLIATTIPSGTSGLVTGTSTFSPITSSTSIAGCPVAPSFRILVNQTGMPAQYLWDPVSFGDDALSFTTDAEQSLTFSLSPTTGQLQFNIIDYFGNPVLLASNQDTHNAGNEAIFFSTATKYQQLGYQPVVANINSDCSIGLTLPYNAANIIQACHGSIYLMLSPGAGCITVSLLMLPYDPSTTTSALPSTTSFLV